MTTSPKVIELVDRANPDKVIAHACATCRIVAPSELAARSCCACPGCGGPHSRENGYRSHALCPACKAVRDESERERHRSERAASDAGIATRLAAAPGVPEAEYTGRFVQWDDHGSGEGFFEDLDAVRDYCLDNGIEPPARVWACTSFGFKLNAESAIESELESGEHHEDAGDWLEKGAAEALQLLMDAWAKQYAADVRTYQPDYKRAVVLDPAEWEHAKAHAAQVAAIDSAHASCEHCGTAETDAKEPGDAF